jgi:hypothetical protein
MSLYFVLREGTTPDRSRPLLVSSDPQLMAEVVELLARRLGFTVPPRSREAALSEATSRWKFKFDDPTDGDE